MHRIFWVAGFCVVAAYGAARAESPDTISGLSGTAPGITPEGALAPISIVEGPGVKVGEGTVLHPIVGMETGFISNVFFEASDENPVGAGILRLIAQAGAGSLSPQRQAIDSVGTAAPNRGVFQYRADLRLTYDLPLSGNDDVQEQGGLGVGALFRGTVYPERTWSFLYLDNFQRLIRPTNFESTSQTNRDINRLQLGLQFAPRGRTIAGLLHYENAIDVFEDGDQQFANRMHNKIGLTASWRFRPVTVLFAEGTWGIFTGLGSDSVKVDSYPLTVAVGMQTLLTLNTSVIARVGYTNGFYSTGPSYSAPMGGVEFGYRYSPRGRVTAMYDYAHLDSINANFYRDHHFQLLVEQQFVPFVVTLRPELRLRQYQGVTTIVPTAPDTRDDLIVAIAAGARYNFRDWLATVIEYRFSSVQTDFMYAAGSHIDDPSYVRHELVAGVRAAL